MAGGGGFSPFVGEARRLMVEGLLTIFDEVDSDGGGPRWVSLEAPSGWGKTRVAQEFYARLAARQQPPRYWPASVIEPDNTQSQLAVAAERLNRRKTVFPKGSDGSGGFEREAGSLPEFVWWGVACSVRNGVPSIALRQDLQQLVSHRVHLEAAWRALSSVKDRHSSKLASLRNKVAEASAIELITGGVAEVAGTTVPGLSLVADLGRWSFKETRERRADNAAIAGSSLMGDTGSSDIVDETVELVCRIARPGLAVVLFVEDFHDADPVLIELIDKLLRRQAALMVVTTSWPNRMPEESDLGRLVKDHGERLIRVSDSTDAPAPFPAGANLGELPRAARSKIVRSYYPDVVDQTLEALVDRYVNPLPLELVCQLPKYTSLFVDGRLDLDPEQIAALPSATRDLYREFWNQLPVEVRLGFAVACLGVPSMISESEGGGESAWNHELMREVAALLDFASAGAVSGEMGEANSSFGWVREVSKYLRQFNEPDQLEVTQNAGTDLLRTEMVDDPRQTILEIVADQVTNNKPAPDAAYHHAQWSWPYTPKASSPTLTRSLMQ